MPFPVLLIPLHALAGGLADVELVSEAGGASYVFSDSGWLGQRFVGGAARVVPAGRWGMEWRAGSYVLPSGARMAEKGSVFAIYPDSPVWASHFVDWYAGWSLVGAPVAGTMSIADERFIAFEVLLHLGLDVQHTRVRDISWNDRATSAEEVVAAGDPYDGMLVPAFTGGVGLRGWLSGRVSFTVGAREAVWLSDSPIWGDFRSRTLVDDSGRGLGVREHLQLYAGIGLRPFARSDS